MKQYGLVVVSVVRFMFVLLTSPSTGLPFGISNIILLGSENFARNMLCPCPDFQSLFSQRLEMLSAARSAKPLLPPDTPLPAHVYAVFTRLIRHRQPIAKTTPQCSQPPSRGRAATKLCGVRSGRLATDDATYCYCTPRRIIQAMRRPHSAAALSATPVPPMNARPTPMPQTCRLRANTTLADMPTPTTHRLSHSLAVPAWVTVRRLGRTSRGGAPPSHDPKTVS